MNDHERITYDAFASKITRFNLHLFQKRIWRSKHVIKTMGPLNIEKKLDMCLRRRNMCWKRVDTVMLLIYHVCTFPTKISVDE